MGEGRRRKAGRRNGMHGGECNGHYNRTPDLGKTWDVVEHVGLSKARDTRRRGTRS